MEAYEALVTRVSATKVGEPAPNEAEESKIIAAAQRAPDHGRLRPSRFLSIRGEARLRFGEILADALERRDPRATPELVERERQKPLRAPLILVVAARVVPNAKIPAVEQLLSAGAAAQNIMIACHALGFNALWKTGDAAYDDGVKEALGFEASDAIVGFLYIGTPRAFPKLSAPNDPADVIRRL
jgi:nitroreductase